MLTSKVFQFYALSPVIPFSIQIIHIKSLFPTNLTIACPWDGLSMVFSFDVHWTTDAFHALKIVLFVIEQCSVGKCSISVEFYLKSDTCRGDINMCLIRISWLYCSIEYWVSCCCGSKNIQSFYVVWLFLCVSLICNGNIAGVRIFLFIISLVK